MHIYRIKKGDTFAFVDKKGNSVTGSDLEYAKGLKIPPAYQDVVIFKKGSRIMFQGTDSKGRVQFIYSPEHNKKANKIKLCNLIAFGETLPKIRSSIAKSLAGKKWTKNKVAALILALADNCHMRIGTSKYKDLYGSTGLTTLELKHITFRPDVDPTTVFISFVGKKGVINECLVESKTIVDSLLSLSQEPRPESEVHIMGYVEGNIWQHIRHTEVNDYLKEFGPDFTSKMFRTWASNIKLIELLQDTEPTKLKPSKRRKELIRALKEIANTVHNTPAISKKSYVDNDLIEMYLEKPVSYRSKFITPDTDSRTRYLNFLRSKCL